MDFSTARSGFPPIAEAAQKLAFSQRVTVRAPPIREATDFRLDSRVVGLRVSSAGSGPPSAGDCGGRAPAGGSSMLGYADSKDSGLLSGATNRRAWLRNSPFKDKWVVAIALSTVVGFTLLLVSLHSGWTPKGSNTEADQLSAECATGAWGQCGGRVGAVAFSGEACCPQGNTCVKRTEEYSQCVPDCQCARHSNRTSPFSATLGRLISRYRHAQDEPLGPVRRHRVRREQVLPIRLQLRRAQP